MGNYNTQYESYYRNIINRRRPYARGSLQGGTTFRLDKNYIMKRLTRDLIGVLCLFVMAISCRIIVTPKTIQVYQYSKKVVNESFDYKGLFTKMKELKLADIQNITEGIIEEAKAKLGGVKTFQEKIKDQFTLPLQGKIVVPYGETTDPITKKQIFSSGVEIEAKGNTEVKACFDGKVERCGKESQHGNYVIIDHGDGIETKYGNLSEVALKSGQQVKKGDVIGMSGNIENASANGVYFELLYMGESQNPLSYFAASK